MPLMLLLINPSVYGGLCSRNLGEIVSADAF